MITIEFDGSQARLHNVDKNLQQQLNTLLTWRHKSTSYLIRYKKMDWLDDRRFCYNSTTNSFATGLIPRVVDALETLGYSYKFKCNYKCPPPVPSPIPLWAYEHQVEIVRTILDYKRCLIESPTGSGKSLAITFLIEQFANHQVLVTVPSINLLHNMTRTLEKHIDEPIGKIGGGKKDWQRITVGVINSLAKHADGKFRDQLAHINLLVIDESHEGASDSYVNLSNACYNTGYRVGLSATNFRSDGADLVLEGVTGPKVLTIPESVMVDLNVIHAPKAFFIRVNYDQNRRYTGYKVVPNDFGPEYITYNTPNNKPDNDEVYTEALVHNPIRNKLAVDVLQKFLVSKGRTGNALMIVERIEHGEILKQLCESRGLNICFVDGSTRKRMEILDEFRSGNINALIASSILNQGEDLPKLELVINCAGRGNERINVQRDGRVVRIDRSGEKKRAIIVDFYDLEPHYLEQHSRKRMQVLNSRHKNSASIVTLEELYAYFDHINEDIAGGDS